MVAHGSGRDKEAFYLKMFERYTEKARRVIFFARYEASQYGSPSIESEHLLLGVVREERAPASLIESIREEIESQITIRERISTSVDMPLSEECERILKYATEEADRLGNKQRRHRASTSGNPARR